MGSGRATAAAMVAAGRDRVMAAVALEERVRLEVREGDPAARLVAAGGRRAAAAAAVAAAAWRRRRW